MQLINKRIVFSALLGGLFSCSVMAESLFSAVHIQPLPSLSMNNLGVENKVPADVWGKSEKTSLQSLIVDITRKPLTPAMRDTVAQMMLRQTSSDSSLPFMFRMEVLMRLGLFEDVLMLINLIPPVHQTSDILKLKAQALFLSGKTKEACEFMTKKLELSQMSEEMRFGCALAKGDEAGAELIFATRLESNELDDTTKALAKKIFLDKDASFDSKGIRARHLYLLGAAGDDIDWSEIALPMVYQKVLSNLSFMPLYVRLEMAERSDMELLSELYTKVDDNTPENNAVLRAKLYQKIKNSQQDSIAIEAVNNYLELARKDGLFLNLASIIRPFLDAITPSEKTKDLAFNAVQVYALSDNADLAYPWYRILQKDSDEMFRMQGVFLEPLIQQLGGGEPKETAKGIRFCQKDDNPYCQSFLDKIGTEGYVSDWAEILNNAPMSRRYIPIVKSALGGLMSSSCQGEALLYAIKLWQESDTTETDVIMVLSETMPKTLVRQLILERYVYQ